MSYGDPEQLGHLVGRKRDASWFICLWVCTHARIVASFENEKSSVDFTAVLINPLRNFGKSTEGFSEIHCVIFRNPLSYLPQAEYEKMRRCPVALGLQVRVVRFQCGKRAAGRWKRPNSPFHNANLFRRFAPWLKASLVDRD